MSSRFDVLETPLPGLRTLLRKGVGDERGYLERMFCAQELESILSDRAVIQINHTLTRARGTVRGMHYQLPPHAEMKFVSCVRGEVFDVAVDLRHGSPSFLRWHAEMLSEQNHRTLVIPEGFAHGFQALTDDCEMLYFHTAAYRPEFERGLNPGDPRIAVAWPIEITELSARDAAHPMLDSDFTGVKLR